MPFDDVPAAHVEDTPDTPTIASLVAVANERFPRDDRPWTGADTLKNVVLMVTQPDGKQAPLVLGLPGDREVDLKRVQAQLEPAEVEVFDAFADYPMLVKGYIGPEVLGEESGSGIRYLVDPRVGVGTRWITGANVNGQHVFDLVCGRDFTPDGFLEAAELREGDPAPDGSGPLELARGIEMGHIFQLDTKLRRGARAQGARPERQARHGHHGLVRARRLARGGRRGRQHLRREGPGLAARAGAVPGARRRRRQGRRRRWPGRPSWPRRSTRPA